MEPGGSIPDSQGSPIMPILSLINPITRIDTYLFKVHSNIVLPPTPRLCHRDYCYYSVIKGYYCLLYKLNIKKYTFLKDTILSRLSKSLQ